MIEDIPVAHDPQAVEIKMDGVPHLRIEVAYEKGGMNMLSGESNGRGYYLSAVPIQKRNGIISFLLFHGGKSMIEPAGRFNAAKLVKIAAEVKNNPVYEKLKAKVVEVEKLVLAEPAPV